MKTINEKRFDKLLRSTITEAFQKYRKSDNKNISERNKIVDNFIEKVYNKLNDKKLINTEDNKYLLKILNREFDVKDLLSMDENLDTKLDNTIRSQKLIIKNYIMFFRDILNDINNGYDPGSYDKTKKIRFVDPYIDYTSGHNSKKEFCLSALTKIMSGLNKLMVDIETYEGSLKMYEQEKSEYEQYLSLKTKYEDKK